MVYITGQAPLFERFSLGVEALEQTNWNVSGSGLQALGRHV